MIYIINLNNNHQEITNNTHNNTTNAKINKTPTKNIGLNNNSTNNKNLNNINLNLKKSINEKKIQKKQSNKNRDEAMEAKKAVEKHVLDKDEIAGYPTFKDKDGSWLVPIYDKKTKKFKSSVGVYLEDGNAYFVLGPQSYSEYKKIIHGKTSHKSNSNNLVGGSESEYNVLNNSKPIKLDVVGKSNYNLLKNQDSIIDNNQHDLNSIEFISSDSYPDTSVVDCNNETIE
ncbi:MAG: hypothetical protein E7Z80_04790 [Methanobrevibacter thaueri]|nr:hypothetical protein [Methanobrevibacter thaueri]